MKINSKRTLKMYFSKFNSLKPLWHVITELMIPGLGISLLDVFTYCLIYKTDI